MELNEESNAVASYRTTYGRHACNAWNCKNRQRNKFSSSSLLVHHFPKDPERCREWLLRAGREDLIDKPILFLSSNLSLCSEHFEPHCYLKKNKLRSDALPTIFNTGQSVASSYSAFDVTEQTEYLSNDHEYCKISPVSHEEEIMEVEGEVVSEHAHDASVQEEGIFLQNSINYYQPEMDEVDNFDDNIENTVVEDSKVKLKATKCVTGNKSTVHVPDALFKQEKSPDNTLENVSIEDIRSLSIQPFTESVFSWEKIPDQICRLCATRNDLHPKQSIVRWLGLLNEIVPGMVALDDGLPQHVCKPCLKKLYTAIRIKAEFTEADEKLQNMGFIKSSSVVLRDNEGTIIYEKELQTVTKTKDEDALCASELHLDHDSELYEELMKNKVDNSDNKDSLETEMYSSEDYKVEDEDDNSVNDESLETEINTSEEDESNNFSNEAATRIENYYIDNNSMIVRNEINFVPSADDAVSYVNKEESVILESDNLIGRKRTYVKANKIRAPIKSNFKIAKTHSQNFEYVECEKKTLSKHKVEINVAGAENEQKLKFNCIKCGETFLSRARLKAHKSKHKKVRKSEELTCKICNGQFLFKRDLILHVGTHYNGKPYGCEQCGKRYRSIFRLKTHKMYHSPPSFSCDECGKKFHLQSVLANHMKAHSEKNRFICDVCGKCMSSESILEGHLRMHKGLKPFQCHLCGKCYQSFDCLRFHKLRHRGARFFCEICGKGTKDRTAMKAHMNTHTKELACKCPICLKTFANANSRAKHLKFTCTVIMCIVCGDTFETVEMLEDHRMKEHCIEEVEKAAKECRTDSILCCVACSLYIAGINQMENHMLKVHDIEGVFKCKQCLKCFLSDNKLEHHVRSCSVEKVRKLTDGGKCIICSEVLITPNEIMKHMRSVHKDYRPYMCEYCPKSFLTKKELENHTMSHIERKPFQCSYCDLSFKTSNALKSHEFAHHQ